jgi:hypothetical protein
MKYEKFITRLTELIEEGKHILATKRAPSPGHMTSSFVSAEPFHEWKAGALSFLHLVFGEASTHFQVFKSGCVNAKYPDAVEGQGVLLAAKRDLEGGFVGKLETLVAADIFNDFIEMAEHLIELGYKDPAASLVGAVLEDGLRKIAKAHGVTLKTKEDIASLNAKLADVQVYNRLTQKRVQVWNDIRNNADHGLFSEYDIALIKEMAVGVASFLAGHLEPSIRAV